MTKNRLLVCAEIFRIVLSHIYLSSGKVSSEAEIGYVPNFEILVHLTWNDPIVPNKAVQIIQMEAECLTNKKFVVLEFKYLQSKNGINKL